MSPNLPAGFDVAAFDAAIQRVLPRFEFHELSGLIGGYRAVAYRLSACAEYSASFVQALTPGADNRYEEDRSLFGFFVSGIAALDSFAYFLHFVASRLSPTEFPTEPENELRRITLKGTKRKFARQFPGDVLTAKMDTMLADDGPFDEWDRIRNVLAHRAVPSRLVPGESPNSMPPSDVWIISPTLLLTLDARFTQSRLDWLISTLSELAVTTKEFTEKYF